MFCRIPDVLIHSCNDRTRKYNLYRYPGDAINYFFCAHYITVFKDIQIFKSCHFRSRTRSNNNFVKRQLSYIGASKCIGENWVVAYLRYLRTNISGTLVYTISLFICVAYYNYLFYYIHRFRYIYVKVVHIPMH